MRIPIWGAETNTIDGMRLPEGEVVFLMTDIVGSSALAEADPDLYIKTLGTHDTVVEMAVREFNGHLLKHRGEGDSTFSVFASPDDALDCAKRIHRDLLARNTIVRSGLNRGVAHVTETDYLGDVVNRCARIRGLANPGQILLSDTVKDAAKGEHQFVFHGMQTLRGMINGAQIYEVLGADSVLEHSVQETELNKLPKVFDRFVGREADIKLAIEKLSDYPLVTLHGPGGIGKTRLSIEVANRVGFKFPGGIQFFDLSQSDSSSFLSIVPSPQKVRMDGTKRLLVIDNCEQIAEHVAAWVSQMTQSNPTVTVLATSQIALEVPGEYVLRLEPLSTVTSASAATELLICRAMERGTSAAVIEPQRRELGEIALRLGGMPLAIELVAGKLKSVPASKILSSLDGLLARDFGDSSGSRWASLSQLCRYSLSLLNPVDHQLARAASVLGTTFCYDAIASLPEEFIKDEFEASESLDRLVKHSIVSAVWARAGVVYRMSDMFRKELLSSVTEEEQAQIIESHALWALSTAETALGSEVAYHEIRPYLDDMVFAINQAIAQGKRERALALFRAARKSWIADEVSAPAAAMTDRLLELYPESCEERAELLNVKGIFLIHQDANAQGKLAYKQAMEMYSLLGNKRRVAVIQHNLGLLHYYDDDFTEAQAILERCLAEARELGDTDLLASATVHLVFVSYGAGDEQSAKAYELALSGLAQHITPLLNGVWMNAKIHFLLINRRVDEAIPVLRRMIVEGAGLKDIAMLARAVLFLSAIHEAKGSIPEAVELLSLCRAFIRDRSVHFFIQDHSLLQMLIQSLGESQTSGEVVPGLQETIYMKLSRWAVENAVEV